MAAAVILKLQIGDVKMSFRRIIAGGSEFATQFQRANAGSVLKTDPVGGKCFVCDGQGKFPRLGGGFSHRKSIFADRLFGRKPHELHQEFFAHLAPADLARATGTTAFFRALFRLGGVPSASSTTMMVVTNFFIPWRSKSMEVRSESDSVTTPRPY